MKDNPFQEIENALQDGRQVYLIKDGQKRRIYPAAYGRITWAPYKPEDFIIEDSIIPPYQP